MLNKGYREDSAPSSAYIPLAERLRPRTLDDFGLTPEVLAEKCRKAVSMKK